MPQKKKLIFHIQNLLAGGIEKVLLELLQALPEDVYETELIITHHLGEKEVLRPQVPPHIPVRYLLESRWLNWAKKKKMTANITTAEKLLAEMILPPIQRRVISKRLAELTTGADVFIDFDMTLGAYHHAIRSKRKVAYCHFSLAHYWEGRRRKLNVLAGRLQQYDRVIMLCDEMKEDAARMYPALAPKIARLYNALDIARIHDLAKEPLTGFDQFESTPFLLSVGRLQESQKDFTTLILAYAKSTREHGVTEPLVIVGKGGYQVALEALAKEEGVGDRVAFVGFQSNPYKWMARTKLFLFSSRYEGLPTVLIEALSLGCCIVATECPTGVREILMDGKAGRLVPVGDVGAMSANTASLVNDEAQQQAFREAAKEILQQFDIRYMMAEFQRIVVEGGESTSR
jgi:glycosyltransferase involved in cell wall biosynthesis